MALPKFVGFLLKKANQIAFKANEIALKANQIAFKASEIALKANQFARLSLNYALEPLFRPAIWIRTPDAQDLTDLRSDLHYRFKDTVRQPYVKR